MPFQVSPGVNVSEIDLTTVVPAVSTTEGAIAGAFRWGPVDKRVLVDSEDTLVARFGKPTNFNAETFFTAANFLSYGNALYVVRAANTTATGTGNVAAYSAIAYDDTSANTSAIANSTLVTYTIKNDDDGETWTLPTGGDADTEVVFIAKYPGALGNSLKVSVCPSANAYRVNTAISNDANTISEANSYIRSQVGNNVVRVYVAVGSGGTAVNTTSRVNALRNYIQVGDFIEVGNTSIGRQNLTVQTIGSVSEDSDNRYFDLTMKEKQALVADIDQSTFKRLWGGYNNVDAAPGTSVSQAATDVGNSSVIDEMHIIVTDEGGAITGVPGTVLEVWEGLSRATDAKTNDGSDNYYKTVLNKNSAWVYAAHDITSAATAATTSVASSALEKSVSYRLVRGQDGGGEIAAGDAQPLIALADELRGYNLFRSAEDVDISLLLVGKNQGGTNGATKANYIIDNIAEVRKDCVVFVSPEKADVVANAGKDEVDDVVVFRNDLRSTSYAVLDSGYKYQYDKYNDMYRWIPLNGDTAGLCVRTDQLRDAWWSPAGFNRGQIKNIVKLAWNPRQAERDVLYKAGVNPVVTFPGEGTVLYGDKTLLAKPSAFDRINVRRLFIVLEKAIATAAKYTLFEFNDDFTRAQFRNLVEPFLRDVQGRRGIYDFRVVCDTTNNTGSVIDRNEFVGDIYIKPAKSINFIQLNFVAVRTGVEFSEVVGQF